jgi:sigma-B regulation protein RsbU (phosphoserine phosphatase)
MNRIMQGDPPPYYKEFLHEKQRLIVSRMRFFCAVTITIYISVSIVALMLDQESFKKAELFIWAFLIGSAASALYINHRVKSLVMAKINAGLFSASLVTALAWLFFIYTDYIMQSSEVMALSAFFISFIIPWQAFEVALVGALHIIGYTSIYAWAVLTAPNPVDVNNLIFVQGGYVDGLFFLVVAIIICMVIRKRDDEGDKKRFALLKEVEAKNMQMAKELALARDVHKTLVPKSTSTQNASIAVSYVPLLAVGGDYATFHVTKEGSLFFLIGDVTGHGIPAALLVNRIYGEIESLVARNTEPGKLMRELDRFVGEHFKHTEMYFSVCSGLLDFKEKTLLYSNYGHPPQILHQNKDNKITLLESQTYLLGIDGSDTGQAIYEGKLRFDNKDRIVLFTDGIIEAKGPDGEMYGMERLEALVKSRSGEQPGTFNSALLEAVDAYRAGPLDDDMFLVTIDIK